MENAKKTPSYKVQAVMQSDKSWPFVGDAYLNSNGSISILLDRRVAIRLADGRVLQATEQRVKLHLRAPRQRTEQAETTQAQAPDADLPF